jgi:outer membrane protein assembly factor BamB
VLAVSASLTLVAAVGGVFAWLILGFVPVRAATGGPFAARSQTPAQASPGAGWPMFGASPARTRFAQSRLRPPFRLLYTIPGGSLIEMPPIVSLGRVVFGTHDGLVIATRADNGARLWTTDLRGCIASSPAARAGIVYVGWSGPAPCRRGKDGTGGIAALSITTGEVLWRFNPGNVESSPAIVGDMLFFSAFRSRSESRVFAMHLGRPRVVVWSYPVASKVASSPALIGRWLFVSAYDHHLYGFNRRTGRLRWRASAFPNDVDARLLLGVQSLVTRRSWTEGGYYATPTVAYRRAFVGAIDGVFSAFDTEAGIHRWSRKLGGAIYGSAAVWHEKVYVGTTDGDFYALSARGGRVLWKRDLPGKILGSPTVTNGLVYIASTARETFVLDARTGETRWLFGDGHYSPLVVAGERAFLVGKGRIYAVENAG